MKIDIFTLSKKLDAKIEENKKLENELDEIHSETESYDDSDSDEQPEYEYEYEYDKSGFLIVGHIFPKSVIKSGLQHIIQYYNYNDGKTTYNVPELEKIILSNLQGKTLRDKAKKLKIEPVSCRTPNESIKRAIFYVLYEKCKNK